MKYSAKNLVMLALIVFSATLSAFMRPTISMADERLLIDLPNIVPTAFGEWKEDVNVVAQVINPQQKATLEKIYSQTLARTYTNSQGYRIMLSIAYGKNQSDTLQLHKPEVCYPAQGFQLLKKQAITLDLLGKPISATRLETSLGRRYEPVTYWTVVGDYVVTSQISKKMAEMRYAMHNRIPDGMLVRVSSIDTDTKLAAQMQTQFSSELIASLPAEYRNRFGAAESGQPTAYR